MGRGPPSGSSPTPRSPEPGRGRTQPRNSAPGQTLPVARVKQRPLDVATPSRHPPPVRRPLALLVLLLPTCSSSAASIFIDVTAGQETNAFAEAPAVARVDVSVTSLDGTVNVKASASPDGGTFDFGNVDNGQQITVAVAGFADGGTTPVMAGQSLGGLLLGGISGGINVFIQRTEQWARPPGGLAHTHVGGVATVVADRFLVLTSGAKATGDPTFDPSGVDSYDLFGLTGDATGQAFAPVPETAISLLSSSTSADTQVLLIAGAGATMLDYSTGSSTPVTTPVGLSSFADVAGGAVISASSGRTFVVGAARRSAASTAVLEVDSDGTLGGFTLTTLRKGAATTWIDGVGLVVAGGNPSGDGDGGATGPGVEVLRDGASTFTSLPFPADAVTGAGAVTGGGSLVLLLGGLNADMTPAATRRFDASVGASSTVDTLDTPTLATFQSAVAYQLAPGRDLVVGDEPGAGGMTKSFIVDFNSAPPAVIEAPLREPRRGASPIPAPNGSLALLGGEHADGTPALSIELFIP